jgi:hypothetical protein
MISTLNSKLSSVELCKANGWKVGTKLGGTEHYPGGSNYCVIEITAIGDQAILAKCLTHHTSEATWVFQMREWKEQV